MYACVYGSALSAEYQGMDQPGMEIFQLNRGKCFFSQSPFAPLKIWSRKTGSTVPSRVSLLISKTWGRALCVVGLESVLSVVVYSLLGAAKKTNNEGFHNGKKIQPHTATIIMGIQLVIIILSHYIHQQVYRVLLEKIP